MRAGPADRRTGRSGGPRSDYLSHPASPPGEGNELEVARTPGRAVAGKHRIGPRHGAAVQFLHPPGLVKRVESIAAEVRGGQVGRAELQVGIVGAALADRIGRPAVQLVVSVVPRGKGVANAK